MFINYERMFNLVTEESDMVLCLRHVWYGMLLISENPIHAAMLQFYALCL